MTAPIYLDHNATTPVAPEVVRAMADALERLWGNPSSGHAPGRAARAAVEHARAELAALLACSTDEVVFTGGGTEADNMALLGVAEAARDRGRHVVTTAIEHPAVERAALALERRGWRVTRVPVDGDGRVAPTDVAAAVRDDTVLVSVMHANNETGVLQPVREIARALRHRSVALHTDAAQTVGKIPVEVDELGVDLLTVAAHKFHGPKGVGALYVRRGVDCAPLLHGAMHEAGRRAGTENVAGIVGLGVAAALARRQPADHAARLAARRDRLAAAIRDELPDAVVHGGRVERLPNTLSIALPGAPAHELLARVPEVATAAGAACHAGESAPSAVLRAMGVPDALARCTLRLSLGRTTTDDELERAASLVVAAALALRGRGERAS